MKLTYNFVKQKFKDSGCALLSTEYVSANTKLDYICVCGNKSKITYGHFSTGGLCRKCGNKKISEKKLGISNPASLKRRLPYVFIKSFFEKESCVLLSPNYNNCYQKLDYVCNCGENAQTTWSSFKQGHRCRFCGIKKRVLSRTYSYDFIKKQFEKNDCELLSKNYKNAYRKLDYICSCGRKSIISWHDFQAGKRCKRCGVEKMTGLNHFHWKGGPRLSKRRSHAKRKLFGFTVLNDYFEGSEGHHIDKEHVVFIPEDLHKSIWHTQNNPESMERINTKVFCWLLGVGE